MIGIIGSYVGRIYTQVKDRPLYGVQDTYGIPARREPPLGDARGPLRKLRDDSGRE